MNITVTYTNGTGRANRYLVAYDQTCVVTLSGLTLTGTNWLYLTTADGMHALANRAQIAANAATLNLSNTGIESLFGVRQTGRIPALLTVRNGSSGNIAGLASVEITPAADPNVDVVRVGIDYATTADIADLQNQIDALEVGALLALSVFTAAGDTLRGTGAGAVEKVAALTPLAEAGAGDWAPVLKANSTHTVTRSGIWTDITPSGLEPGEGCSGRITGQFAAGTTGLAAAFDGALDDIGAAVVDFVIYRVGDTYYGACREVV